eukprot:c18356_g1_i3.p1 GENE.c18356_g1_i3~~c18356_g1_i3.p1  ORF type:complete len:209 (+),score=34.00 c18356_g1_i3:240-866(+)
MEKHDGKRPGLATVLVGDWGPSQMYVGRKLQAAAECHFHATKIHLPQDTTNHDVIAAINKLNADPHIHGILVQLPLPHGLDERKILESVAHHKDVDGLGLRNLASLSFKNNHASAVPCTALGCVYLLKHTQVKIAGQRVMVVGRSNIVGMPIALLMNQLDATVTLCHTRTRNIQSVLPPSEIPDYFCPISQGDSDSDVCVVLQRNSST